MANEIKDDKQHVGQTAGGKGGQSSSGHRGGSGNFAENRQRAADAGRKGGMASHGGGGKSGRSGIGTGSSGSRSE